tara:strand:- start:2906 stop:3172 length:267 start_codon:yes stop_codon:yes gene_type:complete
MATGQQRFFISKIKKGGSMSNYVDKYIDKEGNVNNKLTLNQKGFEGLTDDIELLVEKYTGIEDSAFMKCADIREDIMFLIEAILEEQS